MAVTGKAYGTPLKNVFTAANPIDFDSDTLKASLHTSSYTPNQDTHDFKDDLTNEVTGTNYSAGGVALTTKTVTYDAGTHTVRIDADDIVYANITVSGIRIVVIYKDTGTPSTSPLICYFDLGADQSLAGASLALQLDATGYLKFAV